MTKTTIRESDLHPCEDDDGKQYVVIERQHYSISEPLNGPPEEKPTVKEYRLATGGAVKWLSNETFQIVANDKIIRKSD